VANAKVQWNPQADGLQSASFSKDAAATLRRDCGIDSAGVAVKHLLPSHRPLLYGAFPGARVDGARDGHSHCGGATESTSWRQVGLDLDGKRLGRAAAAVGRTAEGSGRNATVGRTAEGSGRNATVGRFEQSPERPGQVVLLVTLVDVEVPAADVKATRALGERNGTGMGSTIDPDRNRGHAVNDRVLPEQNRLPASVPHGAHHACL
jgi:hypothetical protein